MEKILVLQGKNRQFELGKWFRNRYSSLLPDIFSPNDIYVRSSDVDRTLMSAASNLAGLYPPTSFQRFNEELNWQPIPIHTLPKKQDAVISMKKKCKKYNKQLEKLDDDKFFKDINTKYADLFEFLSNQTGWTVTDISFINELQSIFYTYRVQNPSYIPAWVDSLDQDVMNYLSGLAAAKETYTEKLAKLRVGPFFHYLIAHFKNIIANDEEEAKFLMLSGHEHTVVSVLNSIGAYDYLTPEFATVIIWELKKSEDGAYYINMFYKKEKGITEITLDGCQFNCEFDTFKKVLKPITLKESDWEDKCDG
ncbi:hypothetical protein NQ314_004779 [Rhamnusium bicolor]|uniref:acid phosphatase n=1 Tax=Rhamnusium bicolor TaxID=1586634 RepID=A0AAV8ZJV0_9CUCU|nr:hypothetical protein NQ314_004779 [Rhamnusium bicolor]